MASDVPAILDKTRHVYYIDNMEIAELTKDEVHFYNIDREEIQKEIVEIKWDAESAEKGGYEHFMLKEIHEQPKAVQDMIGAYVKDGAIDFSEVGLDERRSERLKGSTSWPADPLTMWVWRENMYLKILHVCRWRWIWRLSSATAIRSLLRIPW